MRFTELSEADIARKIINRSDLVKKLGIMFLHDETIRPRTYATRIGPRPNRAVDSREDQKRQQEYFTKILKFWSTTVDDSLRNTDFGNLSSSGAFDNWILQQYLKGDIVYANIISGELPDILGRFQYLSQLGVLPERYRDINKLNFDDIETLVRQRKYMEAISKYLDQKRLEKLRKQSNQIVLINNDRFLVTIPLNYGSCYVFNQGGGVQAHFCTGSSTGSRFFNQYSEDGPMILVLDKQNADSQEGKWQIHTPTNQVKNANQSVNSAERFNDTFPGLINEIITSIENHSSEISHAVLDLEDPTKNDPNSTVKVDAASLDGWGWDPGEIIRGLQTKFFLP